MIKFTLFFVKTYTTLRCDWFRL